jgi:hypothetical protein
MRDLSPIVIFVYNRLWYTKKTIQALQTNELANLSELFIYSDAPRSNGDINSVNEVREFIKTIDGFKKVTIIERSINYGLLKTIIDGVTQILDKFETAIVLEDDIIVSNQLLYYSHAVFSAYANSETIRQISFYSIDWNEFDDAPFWPNSGGLPVYFAESASSWGQGWRKEWWFEFYNWYQNNQDIDFESIDLPETIYKWSKHSWKKYFNAFLVENNYLVIYPVDSYSLHIGEKGTNYSGVRIIGNFRKLTKYFHQNILFPKEDDIKFKYNQHLKLVDNIECRIEDTSLDTIKSFSFKDLIKEILRRLHKKILISIKTEQ